jgi:hypothetical protein
LVFLDVGGSPPKPRPKVEGLQRTSLQPPARPRTPPHVQPSPEFDRLSDIEPTTPEGIPALEIQSNTVPGLEPSPSVGDLEPAFDLSITDEHISPLEGLESAADPSQFAIDPAVGPPSPSSGIEGLISSQPGLDTGEPGLGEPLSTEDPLAGLNVLEDDRFFIHEPTLEESPAEAEVPEIDTMEFDIEHPQLHEEEPEPEKKPAPAPVARGMHRAPVRKKEPEPEEAAEEEQDQEEEERPAPKPTKPKLVEPLRMTRPKPKKPKTPPRQEEPQPSAQRQPVNPFMRPRPKPKAPSPKNAPRVTTPPAEVPRAATPKENVAQRGADDNFVDLGDWLREERGPRSTRMVAEEDHNRDEGEEADFTDMLEKFKAGVAANVDDEDFDSHSARGIAYNEMGHIDEAVSEFQKALRGATHRIRAYEALGQCFIDRNEPDVATTVLGRALREPGMEDEDLIGVLYLLGFASEGSKKPRDAAAYYQRVFAIDIDFRDVSKRLKQMTKAASK